MGDDTAVGWIAAIIIGGIAGWLAEQFMKSDMGLLMNIVLGIVGAAIASAILSAFGIVLGGWIGYLVAGFIGACHAGGSREEVMHGKPRHLTQIAHGGFPAIRLPVGVSRKAHGSIEGCQQQCAYGPRGHMELEQHGRGDR